MQLNKNKQFLFKRKVKYRVRGTVFQRTLGEKKSGRFNGPEININISWPLKLLYRLRKAK